MYEQVPLVYVFVLLVIFYVPNKLWQKKNAIEMRCWLIVGGKIIPLKGMVEQTAAVTVQYDFPVVPFFFFMLWW